jgi:alpha-L-fucosidase 2
MRDLLNIGDEFVRIVFLLLGGGLVATAGPTILWYGQPAVKWVDALPFGNGRLGGMVFGGVEKEHIQLNEDTVWNGRKRDRINPEAAKFLPEVRRLLFEGKPLEATKLEDEKLMGIPTRQPPYQPLGDVTLTFAGHENVQDYRRELDLATGIVRVTYRIGNARFTREVFASAPDQAIVMRFSSNEPSRISVRIELSREQDSRIIAVQPDRLVMTGEAIAHTNAWITPNLNPERLAAERAQLEGTGVKFQAALRAQATGGTISVDGNQLSVTKADALTILLVAATKYRGGDPALACERSLSGLTRPFAQLRSAHIADHQALFNRVELNLGLSDNAVESLPTDERLARCAMANPIPICPRSTFNSDATC